MVSVISPTLCFPFFDGTTCDKVLHKAVSINPGQEDLRNYTYVLGSLYTLQIAIIRPLFRFLAFGCQTKRAAIVDTHRIRELYGNAIIVMEDMLRLWLAIAALGAYISIKAIYRLYFHPLSHIPGPKLAACSHLYEFYYNVILSGKFLFEMERMHQKYG